MPNLQFMEQFAPAVFLGLNPHEVHVQGAPLDTPAYASVDAQMYAALLRHLYLRICPRGHHHY